MVLIVVMTTTTAAAVVTVPATAAEEGSGGGGAGFTGMDVLGVSGSPENCKKQLGIFTHQRGTIFLKH
jgi:hypothetical protein